MSIGSRIKEKRIERGWSQRDLAAKMNYSNHSTIGKIESGKVDIPQSRIVQFAEVLHTDVSFLMGWEEEKNGQPTSDGELSANTKMLIDFVKTVPEDKVELILRVMKSIVEGD